ncbi:GNAT family N-acetyltransferase [Haloferula sp.]|uniref:GNAT family N-acetyltransferase n=1 Tax=Haloferula sp. TaxID=2497595 RepID=UPI003C7365F7
MTVQEIPYGSEFYRQNLIFRDLHLRQPLGLNLNTDDTENEADHRHFALLDGKTIIGGLIARPTDHRSMRFRQMWINPPLHGKGHGKHLLITVETILAKEGITHFTLHARQSARDFYLKCDYLPLGKTFTEVGIPHIAMDKHLPTFKDASQ